MRNRETIEFLGLWEELNNPDFKPVDFARFGKEAGRNYFVLTPKKWIKSTGAITSKGDGPFLPVLMQRDRSLLPLQITGARGLFHLAGKGIHLLSFTIQNVPTL